MLFSSHIFTPLEITPIKYLQHDLVNDGSYCVKPFMFWTILQILAHILAILYENSRLYRMNGYHLLTETEGNSVFCGPETVDVSRGRGSTKHTAFPRS